MSNYYEHVTKDNKIIYYSICGGDEYVTFTASRKSKNGLLVGSCENVVPYKNIDFIVKYIMNMSPSVEISKEDYIANTIHMIKN